MYAPHGLTCRVHPEGGSPFGKISKQGLKESLNSIQLTVGERCLPLQTQLESQVGVLTFKVIIPGCNVPAQGVH